MTIKAMGLRVVYKGGVVAVNGVDIVFRKGVVTGIVGPNGAGKTSLLKALARLVPYQGLVYIDGYEVSRRPYSFIARMLSYTSDLDTPSFLSYTVYEALLLSRYPVSRGFLESRRDYEVVDRIVGELGLEKLVDRRLNELSSGELRRVLFAMALAREPDYLLLDEPDSHLDLGGKAEISRIIRRYSSGRTIVLTTHDLLFAVNTVDYVVVMDSGRVVLAGKVGEAIVNKGVLEKIYGVKIEAVWRNGRLLIIPLYHG